MTEKGTTKTSPAAPGGDASEDGDFVALRESRENRVPETLDLSQGELEKILSIVKETRPQSASQRPVTGIVRRKTTLGQEDHWTQLIDAANSGPTAFSAAVKRVHANHALSSKDLLDPVNGQNILHYSVELKSQDLISIVLDIGDEQLLLQQFDVEVSKIKGKKNVLHQVVEQNNLQLFKTLLSKLTNRDKRIDLLNKETPVEIIGQRPRTFPCLHLAAYYGYTELVEFIISQGIDVNHLNAKNDTSLLWASRWGHQATVRSLLKQGANLSIENDKGSTALYWAVRYGFTETVDILAREGHANVSQTRKLGLVAPIVLASALGFEKIVSILLEFGADPNFAIRGGERPIHHAAREGFANIIEILVSKGALVDAADERGDTALLLTAKYGRPKSMQTLLHLGANVYHKNLMGDDVWTFAVNSDNDLILKLLVIHQRKQELENFQDFIRNVNSKVLSSTAGSNSLLFLAASVGNIERIKLLLELKIDASVTDEEGNNFLHHAAINNQAQVIKEFHKIVNIDSVNKSLNTALHEACRRGHHETIMELIQCKVLVNKRNSQGETALHVAANSASIQPHSVSKLMDYVIKTHPWESLNITDNFGNNPLHIAAKFARPEVLWEFRFVRFKDTDVDGNIALHEAVRPGEPEALEMMLDIYDAMKRDCDINHQNKKLQTVLHLAAREGFLDSVRRLILFGADISLADYKGNTVLHILTALTVTDPVHSSKYMEIIETILEKAPQWYSTNKKIKVNENIENQSSHMIRRRAVLNLVCETSNREDLTVLDLACKMGAFEVVQLLVTMEDVMAFKVGRNIRYDISSITPRTNGTLGGMCVKGSISPRPSCLEWLLAIGDDVPQNAAKILDIQPFSDMETAYSSVSAWAYAVIITVHIIYMILFSWSGLTLLYNDRSHPGQRVADAPTLVTYIIVPLEPAYFIFYNVYTLVKLCCMGELSIRSKLSQSGLKTMLSAFMSVIVGIIYSIFVIIWIITYAVDYNYMDYFLAIALCIGWMFSVVFTRGFKVINYFWRLIQIMIIRDVFKFLFIYLFVLLAFSFAFHALFQVSSTLSDLYPNPIDTIFLMFNMWLGMTFLFGDDSVDQGFSAVDRTSVFIKVLYVIYMVLATLVLLNLLIAMMNDSYQEILRKQRQAWRIESVQLGVDVEKSMPITFPMFSKVKVIRGYICPADEANGVTRWYIEVAKRKQVLEVTQVEEETDRSALEELKTKMTNMDSRLNEQIQSLKMNIDDIHTMLKNLEKNLSRH
ncbi:transient receptor potential cation channel subfamily A member 1 [Biomphalaria pfeifferi]|uniref:Transient receptor potential cation channel subfamily A member 1 n=1 Tax=Biomphalaria pfeifferi TaxID=112525 RepID=A0AAD8BRM2_BIOPF|nr:transient receptor potential cation channel subfamily A member 1 [Biomphalaria pfeifferi]